MKDEIYQNHAFSRLEGQIGREMALYCMCAVYDLPYDPEAEAENWQAYKATKKDGTFSGGDTDVNSALLAGMPTQERWETIWGAEYTESDYKQLDYYYNVMISQLDNTGGLDPQQKDAAMSSAKMRLNKDKLLLKYTDKDAIATAKQLDQMIRETLKDSNMRKADILPTQAQRLDGFVDALQKAGLGVEMTEEDVLNVFFAWLKKQKYPEMTTDAADWMLLSILRTMAKNDDLPEPMALEENMSLAAFESEFSSEPNEDEQAAYEYLGFVRGGAVRKKSEDG